MRGMRLVAASLVGLLAAHGVAAQELPLRTWSVRDGLAQSRVNAVLRDSTGYVWFATWDGASRFDGREFVDYGALQGLPNPLVWCLAEAPDGALWMGTHGGGLARVADTGRALIAVSPDPSPAGRRVFDVAFDGAGRLWAVTAAGLFRCADARAQPPRFERVAGLGEGWSGLSLLDDAGRLWFVTAEALLACDGSEVESLAYADDLSGPSAGELRAVLRRRAGGAWIVHSRAVFALELPAAPGARGTRTLLPLELADGDVLYDLCEDARGRLWVAASRGLACIEGGATRWFDSSHGLPDVWIRALEADPRGGVWIGTHQGGVALLADSGVERTTARGGLGDGHAVALARGADGRWIVATELAGLFELDGGRARLVPGTDRPPFDRVQRLLLCDPATGWWLGTSAGTYRVQGELPEPARAELVGESAGLPALSTRFLELDRAGRVVVGDASGGVYVHDAALGRFERLPLELPSAPLRALAQTGDDLWYSDGTRLWRRREGCAQEFALDPDGGSDVQPRALLVDRRGWLWVGTRFAGAAFVRAPAADAPRFQRLGTREGLASDVVYALAEDGDGALYLGTGRGIQRYRPEQGLLEAFGEDAVASEWVLDLEIEGDEALWAASGHGVVRIPLRAGREGPEPARVRLTRCIAGGTEVALPGRGALELPALELGPSDNDLWLEFAAVDPLHGAELRYQTRLHGHDESWGEPVPERSVRFAGLSPGSYRFEVRSFAPGTQRASAPTGLDVRVARPLWQRPWALALTLGSAVGLGWLAQHARSRRALALERLRLRIAQDLHDDLGAGLASIAITSELSRADGDGRARERMGEVAQLARDLRGSMGDLVWAVDPAQDGLVDVAGRLRQVCGEMVTDPAQSLEFEAPEEGELARHALGPEQRRQLVLFLKEALANVARHARAERVRVELALEGERLRLSIADDGCGFDPARAREGRGLGNLRRRAQDLGGSLRLDSAPGAGTRIALEFPLRGGRGT
jgi:signal transduction histidine kinase/ligand-binding sensor domain-containing protein